MPAFAFFLWIVLCLYILKKRSPGVRRAVPYIKGASMGGSVRPVPLTGRASPFYTAWRVKQCATGDKGLSGKRCGPFQGEAPSEVGETRPWRENVRLMVAHR